MEAGALLQLLGLFAGSMPFLESEGRGPNRLWVQSIGEVLERYLLPHRLGKVRLPGEDRAPFYSRTHADTSNIPFLQMPCPDRAWATRSQSLPPQQELCGHRRSGRCGLWKRSKPLRRLPTVIHSTQFCPKTRLEACRRSSAGRAAAARGRLREPGFFPRQREQ